MKFHFRVSAICLAAVLLLGMLPSGSVYADDAGTECPQVVEDPAEAEENEEPMVITMTDGQDPAVLPEEETVVATTPDDDSTDTVPQEEAEAAATTPDDDSTDTVPQEEAEAAATMPDDDSTDTVPEGETVEETPAVDLDALTAWVQEHPEQLRALYAGEQETITALAEALGAEKDDVAACVADLKAQNDKLVQAMENGEDVLNTVSFSTQEEAAETLGVTVTAIELFSMKLGYLSGLLGAASDEAEGNDQLDDWMEQLGKALSDEELLAETAEAYNVEPAVLAALLQSMGIEPIDDEDQNEAPSLTIKNVMLDEPTGVEESFSIQIFLWDPNATAYSSSRALTGTYGDAWFSRVRLDAATAAGFQLDGITGGYYGCAEISFGVNESVEITGLPEGCSYFIIEGANENYYLQSMTDTQGMADTMIGIAYVPYATGHNEVCFTNKYAPNSFQVGEKVVSSDPDSLNEEFEFTVYFYKHDTSANTPLFDGDAIEIEIDANGTDGVDAPDLGETMTFTKTERMTLPGMSIPGEYNVATFTLKNGQNVIFKNLGKNYGYYVVETPNIHYALEQFAVKQIYTGGVTQDTCTGSSYQQQYYYLDTCNIRSALYFQNAQEALRITKKVENSDTTRDFVFHVFFTRYNPDTGAYASLDEGDYELTYTNGNGDVSSETVHIQVRSDITRSPLRSTTWSADWAAAEIRVAAGQTVTIEGLPMGTAYIVEELSVTNYTANLTELVNANALSNVSAYNLFLEEDSYVTFTNTYTPPEGGSLTIGKTVTGNMGDTNREFAFRVTLTDEDSTPLDNQDIMVLLPDETETARTTDDDGTLTFHLKHGQQVILENLPQGTRYTIEELEASNYTTTFDVTGGSYNLPVGQTLSGALDSADDVTVQVTNALEIAVPTGIETEIQPFALVLALALGYILLWSIDRRKNRRAPFQRPGR